MPSTPRSTSGRSTRWSSGSSTSSAAGGETRLHRFYKALGAGVDALVKRYEMNDSGDVWLCTQKLKEQGIDLDEWDHERG